MATFYATFAQVSVRDNDGQVIAEVMKGRGAEGLTALTTSGASGIAQRSSADWSAPADGYVTMRATGAVWVRIAAAPTAAAGADFFLGADERFDVAVVEGDKIAVIDA